MSYADAARAAAAGARGSASMLGLERMRALLDRLGAPDRRLGTVVHVGGTNGKGSTVAMIAALAARGRRARRDVHVAAPVDAARADHDRRRADRRGRDRRGGATRSRAAGGDELTFFEQVTAIACVAIADAQRRRHRARGRARRPARRDQRRSTRRSRWSPASRSITRRSSATRSTRSRPRRPASSSAGQRVVIGASGEPAAVPLLVDARARGRRRGDHRRRRRGGRRGAAARRSPARTSGATRRPRSRRSISSRRSASASSARPRARALAGVRHPGRFEVIDGGRRLHPRRRAQPARRRARSPRRCASAASGRCSSSRSPPTRTCAAIAAALAPVVRAVIATRYQQERAMARPSWRCAGPRGAGAVRAARATRGPSRTRPICAPRSRPPRRLGAPILVAGSLFLVGEARVAAARRAGRSDRRDRSGGDFNLKVPA